MGLGEVSGGVKRDQNIPALARLWGWIPTLLPGALEMELEGCPIAQPSSQMNDFPMAPEVSVRASTTE